MAKEFVNRQFFHRSNVHWLRRGSFLQKLEDVLKRVKKLLLSRSKEYAQLVAYDWLVDSANKWFCNENLKKRLTRSATFFKNKLQLLPSQLKKNELRNFSVWLTNYLRENVYLLKNTTYYEKLLVPNLKDVFRYLQDNC
jgi:hypothetical protein